MVDLNNIKSAWQTPTGLTVTNYSPSDMHELLRVINLLLQVQKQDHMVEISFSNWSDPQISKIGVMMITPAVFLTIDDYITLCNHFKRRESQHDHINICGKDKLYIDSNFNTEPFNNFLELIPKAKELKAQSMTDLNKILTEMIGLKRLDDNYRYTFYDLSSQYLVHNSEQSILNCMYVMICKVFSYYNPLINKFEFLKAGDRSLTYFLSDNCFLSTNYGKHHYDDKSFGMYITLYSSFVQYYRGIVSDLTERGEIKVIDHYSRYVVFNESFMEKYKNSCCYVVEYNDKRFVVFESKEQIRNLKKNGKLPQGFSDSTYVLFEKHLDNLYKMSLLKSGCGGYDEIKLKDVPLK